MSKFPPLGFIRNRFLTMREEQQALHKANIELFEQVFQSRGMESDARISKHSTDESKEILNVRNTCKRRRKGKNIYNFKENDCETRREGEVEKVLKYVRQAYIQLAYNLHTTGTQRIYNSVILQYG